MNTGCIGNQAIPIRKFVEVNNQQTSNCKAENKNREMLLKYVKSGEDCVDCVDCLNKQKLLSH